MDASLARIFDLQIALEYREEYLYILKIAHRTQHPLVPNFVEAVKFWDTKVKALA